MNDLQSTFLILSACFSSTSGCFSSGIIFKIVPFQLEALCLCCAHSRKKTKQNKTKQKKKTVFFPSSVTPLSTMLWSRAVMYPERGLLKCITIGIHLILVKATWPGINHWQSLFCWVKVKEYNNTFCLNCTAQ